MLFILKSLIVGTNEGSLYVYAIKNTPAPTKASDLEDIIKLSLISQLENIEFDEEEENNIAEKHQLESINRNPKEEENPLPPGDDEEDKLAKMDAFQANLDKIKNQNAKLLKDKKPKDKDRKNGDDDSSDSDEIN